MIRTRFSPSPTGMLHLGNARTALFSALYAAHHQGAFILRIEDTDAVRSEQKYTDLLQANLHWLGVYWQEGPDVGGPYAPYHQSARHDIYDSYYQKLMDQGLAYFCFCTDQALMLNRKIQLSRGQAPRYPGTCRHLTQEETAAHIAKGLTPALRFSVPKGITIDFVDLVKGPQSFQSDDIGDFLIRRADKTASFLFSNAIDDSLMNISHVVRGDDHLANTPRQLMLLEALQLPAPHYSHLSMITGDDGAPLSKRHGSFSLHDLREQGYISLAVMNYLARLSHSYENQKLMSFSELAKYFYLEKISRAPARFDRNQLLHWQKEAVMAESDEAIFAWLGDDLMQHVPESKRHAFADVMKKNVLFPADAKKWVKIFFQEALVFQEEQTIIFKQAGVDFFKAAIAAIQKHGEDIKAVCNDIKTQCNVSGKLLFMPLRVALTGEQHGPELAHIASLLGQDSMLKHVQHASELARKS